MKKIFWCLNLFLVSLSVSADIWKDQCTTHVVPSYGGYAGCYASIGVPGWPTLFLDGNFAPQASPTVRISREVRDNCIGTATNCPSFGYICDANLPFISNKLVNYCIKTLVDSSVCDVPAQNRIDAGYSGISWDECQSRDMCVQSVNNIIQCYLPKSSSLTRQYHSIKIKSGVSNGRVFLSTPISGKFVDLWDVSVLSSGRQSWYITLSPDGVSYNIIVKTGIDNSRKYLSVNNDGTTVDLWNVDDGSGRQRWIFSGENIMIKGGVSGNRKYLSTTGDGKKVDLWTVDDGSGRQKWGREAIPK
jgi:Trefoil (P-type) domain